MSETMTASYAYDSSCASPVDIHPPISSLSDEEWTAAPVYVSPSRSDRFWFEDGTVVIKVDNTLYNVYRGILRQHSSFFRSKLAAVSSTKPIRSRRKGGILVTTGYGSSQSPLSLDVAESEFETLLSYMHPTDYENHYELTVKEWSAIVNVSTKLELTSIRATAVANILRSVYTSVLDLIDIIDIGRKHAISECYVEGCRLLCFREESLSLEEGQSLGLATVIMIARARDMLAKGSKWSEVELEISNQFDHEV